MVRPRNGDVAQKRTYENGTISILSVICGHTFLSSDLDSPPKHQSEPKGRLRLLLIPATRSRDRRYRSSAVLQVQSKQVLERADKND